MIVKLNHLQGKAAATSAQDVIGTIYTLLEEGHIEKAQFARLQIELDWIQYKQNFREVVIATHGYNEQGQQVPIMDVHVDTRQVVPGCLRAALLRALAHSNAPEPAESGPAAAGTIPIHALQHRLGVQQALLEPLEGLGNCDRQGLRAGAAGRRIGRPQSGSHRR